MKNRSIKLKIDQPCHENWDAMLPVEQGRFCNSCEKQVVDLSAMTDLEIIRYMDANKGKSICGNARTSQLERPIEYNMAFQNKANPNFSLRMVLMGASLSALLGLESCGTSEHRTRGEVVAVEHPKELRGDVAMEYDHKDEHLATGVIYKNDSIAVAAARIGLFNAKDEEVGKTTSKNDGSFRLDIDWEKEPVYMKIEREDFESQMIYLSLKESLQEMNIILISKTPDVMGKVQVIEEK